VRVSRNFGERHGKPPTVVRKRTGLISVTEGLRACGKDGSDWLREEQRRVSTFVVSNTSGGGVLSPLADIVTRNHSLLRIEWTSIRLSVSSQDFDGA